jgi:hypothetical protein
MKRRPSAAMIVAMIALFVALSGVGVAATGGNFILGQTNSATRSTNLKANADGKVLQLVQEDTAASASGLGINVRPGQRPITTNSSTKVANLNVDLIDGLDSDNFVQGLHGRINMVRRTVALNSFVEVLNFGWFKLSMWCTSGSAVFHVGSTEGNIDIATDSNYNDYYTSGLAANVTNFDAEGGASIVQVGQAYRVTELSPPRHRMVTLYLSGKYGSPCSFQAQALAQGF